MGEQLEKKEYDNFFKKLETYLDQPVLEQPIQDIQKEWRNLHIAKRNGLMDDEQIHLAMTAFYKKKAKQMLALQEEE